MELPLLPLVERVVVTLRTLNLDAEEHPRRFRRPFLGLVLTEMGQQKCRSPR